MNRMKYVALCLLMTTWVWAARAGTVGASAPELKDADWIRGDPLSVSPTTDQASKFTVVEFWATWCPPCRDSIPHLTELQKRYEDQGVRIVGVSNETRDVVERFVQRMGDKMGYRVVSDASGEISRSYMQAFGQSGIPHAFLVDPRGKIIWHGHPMLNLERVIREALRGDYDMEAFKKAEVVEKQWIPTYARMVIEGNNSDQARELAERILNHGRSNPSLMNNFSWFLLTDERIQSRDLNVALAAAKIAFEGTERSDASSADTYARALFDSGDVEEAIRIESLAVAIETDTELKRRYQNELERFKESL